ncbi:MAG: FAD:protein transferase [Rhizobacter sp.]|nr:FAD:protein transferase [Rhizobacter sp.]
MSTTGRLDWVRRAKPLLGTIVEIGLGDSRTECESADLFAAAFAEIARLDRILSRFAPGSDVSRFNGLQAGFRFEMRPEMVAVMTASQDLRDVTHGLFDISVGSATRGWRCDGPMLFKLDDVCRLDLGGIGKGHVVDCIVATLRSRGCSSGWVNAGGDLRAFGEADVPVVLRDETNGGARPFAIVADGAFATSRLAHPVTGSNGPRWAARHVSVAAPECLFADALTKVVAATGDIRHPLLARHGAVGFIHDGATVIAAS